jgi:hypothetical protein
MIKGFRCKRTEALFNDGAGDKKWPPGTGRGRVEHARAARWLASQRLRSSMRCGNVSCHHNRNPFLEVNFVLEKL